MSLRAFVDDVGETTHALAVVDRSVPRPLQNLLVEVFEGQPVDIEELDAPESEGDQVLLLEDGEVIATSPLEALQRSILLVNSDLYITGSRDLDEVDLPAVLEGLTDVPFRLRGYPESNKQKLLLITVSRYIERIAWEADEGTLRTSFQHLSRIEDEQGTRTVYEQLAETDVDVHVYGVPDWTPPVGFDVTIHGGRSEDFLNSWFVVYTPEDDEEAPIALLAYEVEPRVWKGFFTRRGKRVRAIDEYIERTM